MEKGQIFDVVVDGVEQKAELIDIVEYEGARYAVYSIDVDEEASEIYVSKIVTDAEGYDELVDVAEDSVKEYVINIIQEAVNS